MKLIINQLLISNLYNKNLFVSLIRLILIIIIQPLSILKQILLYKKNFKNCQNTIKMPSLTNVNNPMNKQKRRVLPPDVQDQITFGIMWIRIGKLKLNRNKGSTQNKVIIQFWGEKQPILLQTKSNLLNKNQQATMVQYDIKCPITYFKEYLLDMKKNLKFQVQDVGKVDFDITKFIKPNIDLTSKYVFDHFKGVFEIVGQHHRKIGSIEIQMASNFNPQIAALQLGQNQQQNLQRPIYQDHQYECRHEIVSPGIDKKMAIDILSVQNPQLLKQFYEDTVKPQKRTSKNKQSQFQNIKTPSDNRIANSLNTQMTSQRFDPNKYLQQQKPSSDNKIKLQQNKNNVSRNSRQPQPKIKQLESNQKQQARQSEQISNFPTIQKVLTYSNLRLAKEQSIEQNIQNKFPSKNVSGVMNQQVKTPKNLLDQQSNSHPSELQQQFYEAHYSQNRTSKKQSPRKYSQKQMKKNEQKIKKQRIQSPRKIKPQKQNKQLQQSNLLQSDKQILSRVVNLDEQLKKSQINSPVKKQPQNTKFAIDKEYEFLKDKKQEMENIKMSIGQQFPNPDHNIKQSKANRIIVNQNQIKPITQHRTQYPFLPQQDKNRTGQKIFSNSQKNYHPRINKPSSLILNLIVQIDIKSVGFYKKKQKFHIIHRPYGCKQRIKLGPRFESDKLTIMCPVGEQLVNKMDKMPFIIQFWGAVSQQFLGFIKINLVKIKKGFILQGRLNQIAIKSSLLPIIIQKGEVSIQNVNGQKAGICNIYAAIGTSSQIELYINSDRKQQRYQKIEQKKGLNQNFKKKPNKQSNQRNHKKGQLNLNNLDILITNLLQYIDKSSSQNIQHLAEFMKKNELTQQQFQQFLIKINSNQQRVNQIVYTFKNLGIQAMKKEKVYVSTLDFKRSFDQFKQLKQDVMKQFRIINQRIGKRIPENVRNQIIRHSNFNIIQKVKLKQIYLNHLNSLSSINQSFSDPQFQQRVFQDIFLTFFQQYMNVTTIFTQSKIKTLYEPPIKCIIQKVYQSFNEILFKNNITYQDMEIYFTIQSQNIKFQQKLWNFCQDKLKINSNDLSIWYWVCLTKIDTKEGQNDIQKLFLKRTNELQKLTQKRSIIQQKLATQLQKQQQRKKFQSENTKLIKPQNQQRQKPRIQQGSMSESNIHQLLNNKNLQSLIGNIGNILPNDSQRRDINNTTQNVSTNNVLIQKQNIDNSNVQLSMNQQKQRKYTQYIFVIKGVELYLQNPVQGDYEINYTFPYDQDQIISKKIKTLKNKHRYTISLYGQHKITIDSDIKTYMNQVPVKFQLIKLLPEEHSQLVLQGDLHSDQIILQNNSKQSKVVPLFSQDNQKIQGKIKLEIQYKYNQTQKQNLGKQTIYNLFLPKNGFINFNFNVKLQQKKIKSQYNFTDDQFYVCIVIDMFNQNKNLKPHYPPICSKLYSNFDQPIQFSNSIKTSLNPVILDYIKQKNCLLSINIIYYSKQKGNYQKYQKTFATLKIPLFNLIKQDGIQGNYAFKNKYGMFVGLCKSEIKYNKYQKKTEDLKSQTLSGITAKSREKLKQNNFTIFLHFKQLINFQQTVQTTFLKFQTIFKGTKYQTQKIHLSDDHLMCFNDYIALGMSQQDFYATKILPISIQFDNKQKFAIDISLRPVIRKLNKQKYFVSSGYFLVSDENSQLTKMRVGARMMVFKESSLLQNFISSLCNNLDFDVFAEIDLARDLQNYPKLLQIFKNGLKLTNRVFEDSLKHLLSSKTQKLSLQIMSSQILYKLDLSPLIGQNQQEVESFIRNTSGTMNLKQLQDYVKENNYKIKNFEKDIINKYSFQSLWMQNIDKNVEYFNLSKQIDVLTLGRKIKVFQSRQTGENEQDNDSRKYKQLRIILQKGINFHYLYNGIKPNVLIKVPKLGYQSKIKPRTSEPVFNQTLRQSIEPQNFNLYRNLLVEVYHIPNGSSGQVQDILIGQGSLNIFKFFNLADPRQKYQKKQAKIIIQSALSSKMKAHLEVTLDLGIIGQNEYNEGRRHHEQQQVIEDASRIQEMIKDINKDMQGKKYLFEQSSDDDQY